MGEIAIYLFEEEKCYEPCHNREGSRNRTWQEIRIFFKKVRVSEEIRETFRGFGKRSTNHRTKMFKRVSIDACELRLNLVQTQGYHQLTMYDKMASENKSASNDDGAHTQAIGIYP
jgi:hypothetical protein